MVYIAISEIYKTVTSMCLNQQNTITFLDLSFITTWPFKILISYIYFIYEIRIYIYIYEIRKKYIYLTTKVLAAMGSNCTLQVMQEIKILARK